MVKLDGLGVRRVQKIKYRLQITKQWAGYGAQSGKQYFCGFIFC